MHVLHSGGGVNGGAAEMPSMVAAAPQPSSTAVGGGDPKLFCHYCYVCNTQLNSCKQALLHCNGKRHQKKLQFLQTRQQTIGSVATLPASAVPGITDDISAHLAAQRIHPNGQPVGYHQHRHQPSVPHRGYGPPPPFGGGIPNSYRTDGVHPPPHFAPIPAVGHCHRPYPYAPAAYMAHRPVEPLLAYRASTVPSASQLAGTEHWLHPPPPAALLPPTHCHQYGAEGLRSDGGAGQDVAIRQAANGGGFLPITFVMNQQPAQQQLTPPPYSQQCGVMTSPFWSNDCGGGGGSYGGGTADGRSPFTVLSPSDTSSLSSSDPSSVRTPATVEGGGSYRCYVCCRQYSTGALLHSHLQTAKHFKHHHHHFHSHSTLATSDGSGVGVAKGDSSETDSLSSLHYCSVCSIAVNSQAQLQLHHAGQKHRHRTTNNTNNGGSLPSHNNSGGEEPVCDDGDCWSPTSLDAVLSSRPIDDDQGEPQTDVSSAVEGRQPQLAETVGAIEDGARGKKTVTTPTTTVESGYASGSGDEEHTKTAVGQAGEEEDCTDVLRLTSSDEDDQIVTVCHVCDDSGVMAIQQLEGSNHTLRANSIRPVFRRKGSAKSKKASTPSCCSTNERTLVSSSVTTDQDAPSVSTLLAVHSVVTM